MACSSEPLEPSDVAGEEQGEPSPFAPCPLFTETGEGQAECAIFERPLLTDDPSLGTIPFFVKRMRATEARRGQLWILPGGPGASSQWFEGMLEQYSAMLPDLDVYVPDHRGTGNSALLDCPVRGLDECGKLLHEEWGPGLSGFRTTEAARDVAAVIRATRAPGDQVLVHGASYGGYWLNRLLAVDPKVADGAIFESSARAVTLPGGATELARGPDEAGHRLFELCALDPECRSRFGDDGYAKARKILDHIGDCDLLESDPLRLTSALGNALPHWRFRELIPALFHRIERCTEADAAWVQDFFGALNRQGGIQDEAATIFSRMLNWHIQGSEMVGPIVEEELEEVQATTLFNEAAQLVALDLVLENWPRYAPDEFTDRYASVSVPVLVIHGGLDATTAMSGARAIAEHVSPRVTFLDLPGAQHGVEWWPAGTYCGRDLMVQFLKAPDHPLDVSCVENAPPPVFASDPEWLLDNFGSDDVWGD